MRFQDLHHAYLVCMYHRHGSRKALSEKCDISPRTLHEWGKRFDWEPRNGPKDTTPEHILKLAAELDTVLPHELKEAEPLPEVADAKLHVYGYCPVCGAPGELRERRPNGNDVCVNGHTYPSAEATLTPKTPTPVPENALSTIDTFVGSDPPGGIPYPAETWERVRQVDEAARVMFRDRFPRMTHVTDLDFRTQLGTSVPVHWVSDFLRAAEVHGSLQLMGLRVMLPDQSLSDELYPPLLSDAEAELRSAGYVAHDTLRNVFQIEQPYWAKVYRKA